MVWIFFFFIYNFFQTYLFKEYLISSKQLYVKAKDKTQSFAYLFFSLYKYKDSINRVLFINITV